MAEKTNDIETLTLAKNLNCIIYNYDKKSCNSNVYFKLSKNALIWAPILQRQVLVKKSRKSQKLVINEI